MASEAMTTKSSAKDNCNMKSITEGSSTMMYPADQESTVFYNPVQVQNRDLSILMITLYAERLAVRKAVKAKKKEMRLAFEEEHKEKKVDKATWRKNLKEFEASMEQKLKDYEASLDGTKLVAEQDAAAAAAMETDKDSDNKGNDCDNGLTIFEALAASGLRSIRYWKEIPGVKHITINDLDKAATERAHANLKCNELEDVTLPSNDTRQRGICVHHGDATHELYLSRRSQQLKADEIQLRQKPMWDVIDLDPYGSAAPFLDGAVQAVESGGLLCITCTDMAALGGSHPETAFGRYAALPIQSAKYLHELALRILLHTVAVSAARYGRTIRPILSVGMAFYVRVFVEVNNDKRGVSDLSLKIGHVYQSTRCPSFVTLPHGQMGGKKGNVYQSIRLAPSRCPETDAPFKVGGPMWLGQLHDLDVVKTALSRLKSSSKDNKSPKMELIATRSRLEGLLTSVIEEIDAPLYYQLPDLCKTLHSSSPPQKQVMAGIHNAGYEVSGFHKEPNAIKTNAPSSVVWDVLRAWMKKHPAKKTPDEGSAAHKILSVEPSIEVDFTIPKSFKKPSSVRRFPMNPEKNWGPKPKATGDTETNKRKVDDAEETGVPGSSSGGDSQPSAKRVATED